MLHLLLYLATFCCAALPPMNNESIKQAPLIFVGEVVDVIENRNEVTSSFHNGHGDGTVYSLKVIRAFKGIKKNEIVKVYSEMSSVGIHAFVGQKWLMVPRSDGNGRWITDICSHSGNLTDKRAKKNVRFLKRKLR